MNRIALRFALAAAVIGAIPGLLYAWALVMDAYQPFPWGFPLWFYFAVVAYLLVMIASGVTAFIALRRAP
jgi:hypothetical protein